MMEDDSDAPLAWLEALARGRADAEAGRVESSVAVRERIRADIASLEAATDEVVAPMAERATP